MPETVDELYDRWQRNPDPARTAALCEALGGSARADLVEIVGTFARGQQDVAVLLSAGRMYAQVGRLEDAQAALVAAGHLAPRDGEVFRWLGEVLLRQGDAERAERVLARALQFAGTDPEAALWLAHARRLMPTQRTHGTVAVEAEIARIARRPQAAHPDEPTIERGRSEPHGSPVAPRAFGGWEEPPTLVRRDEAPARARAAAPPQTARNVPASAIEPPRADDIADLPRSTRAVVAASSAGWTNAERAAAPRGLDEPTTLPRPAQGAPLADEITTLPHPEKAPPIPPPVAAKGGVSAEPSPHTAHVPEARDVLDALRLVGIYEPDGSQRAAEGAKWERPERGKVRIKSIATLASLAVLTIAVCAGTLSYVKAKRERQHLEAEALLAKVEGNLLLSDRRLLDEAERDLGTAFDLDSRSPRAAIAWIRERGLRGLLDGGDAVVFQDAISRAREVGVGDSELAFANVASFLVQDDVAGALDAVGKWEPVAQGDPWFELFAGAAFERAGDPRAASRYQAAQQRAPHLLAAAMLSARAHAFEGVPAEALALSTELRASSKDRPEADAFALLGWLARTGQEAPPLAPAAIESLGTQPRFLRSIPPLAGALAAQHAPPNRDAVHRGLSRALATADAPSIAVRIGQLAITSGDLPIARAAAISSLSMAPTYVPGRILAARISLLEGHLDDAAKAASELSSEDPRVRAIKAAIAYERADVTGLRDALEGLSAETSTEPDFAILTRGRDVLLGRRPTHAIDPSSDALWSEEIAVDAALLVGDLDLAAKRTSGWADPDAFRAARLARLARLQDRLEEADKWSLAATRTSPPALRAVVERVRVLVAMDKAAAALAFAKATPAAMGSAGRWLRAYALASAGKGDEARASILEEDPPGDGSPVMLRALAASTFAAMKDTKRGRAYVRDLAQSGIADPDIATAASSLGGARPAARKR